MLGKSNQNGKNEIIQLKTPVEFELAGIERIDKHLKTLDKEHKNLTIREDNKTDYERVRLAIGVRRNLRGKITAHSKDKKADAITFSKACNAEEKRINDWLLVEEEKLKKKKKVEDDRIAVIKAAEAEKEEKRKNDIRILIVEIQNMGINSATFSINEIDQAIKELTDINPDPEIFAEFTPEALETVSNTAEILEKARANRIKLDQEEADRKAETERLEKERKELAEIKAKQDKKDEELKAVQKKILDDKAELEAEKEKHNSDIQSEISNNGKMIYHPSPGTASQPKPGEGISQNTDNSEPDTELLWRDKERIRIFAEKLQDLDVPEILDPDLIDFLDTELLNISMVAKRLLEGIE